MDGLRHNLDDTQIPRTPVPGDHFSNRHCFEEQPVVATALNQIKNTAQFLYRSGILRAVLWVIARLTFIPNS